MNGIILFAHGSRDPAWALPFEAMRQRVIQAAPEVPCELAYLELMQPDFASATQRLVARGATHIRVLPIFFAVGKHLRVDLPDLVSQALQTHAGLQFEVLPAAGESIAMQNAVVALALQG